MKGTTTAAAIAALASFTFASAKVDLSSVPRKSTAPTIPGAYIIELDPTAVGPGGLTGKRSATPHADLYEELARRGVNWDVRNEYNGDLFVGASLSLGSEKDLVELANTKGVVGITPVRILPRPVVQKNHVLSGPDDAELQSADAQSVHIMTGVNKLHDMGITGKGVRIGIIDSGFNWHHPNLGGCFGPGCKIAYGHDFVGDAYDGSNAPTPDDDPDDCGGHGTHVTGIVGANPGNQFNMSGVAYEATIGGYRVFGCSGGVGDDVLVDAITRAYKDGNDVITMSLGGPAGWTESVSAVLSSRVAKAGRIVTIAAGNEGASGAFYASGPATGIEVISVASVDNTVIPVQNAKSSDRDAPIPYYSLFPLNFTESLPIYAISKEIVNNDGCAPLPDSTPDLSGFVVLIRRGTCALVDKLATVAAKGARVALIYNNGGSPNAFESNSIPGAMISSEDGAYLLGKFVAGQPPKISFPQGGAASAIPADTGGLVSTFSTYGPTFDAYLKPSVAAPGGGIVSTVPLNQGSWAIMSGTSMATPYMAGVSALLLAYKGRKADVSRAARDLFESTANIIPSSKADGALYQTASQQGAGIVNAFKALTYTSTVAPGQLLLNDTVHFNGKQSFTVKNTGKKQVTYSLTHTPAGTAHTLVKDSIQAALYPVPLGTEFASVSLSETKFTLKPGQSKKVTAKFTAPKVDSRDIPVYSGWIEVTGKETGEVLSVTYMGIAANLKDSKVIDNTDFLFGETLPGIIDQSQQIVTAESTWNFKNGSFPSVLYRLVFGTPTLVLDLVSADFNESVLAQRDLQKRGWLDDLLDELSGKLDSALDSWWSDLLSTWAGVKPAGTFGKVPTVGPLAQFDWNPRNAESADPGVGYSVFALETPVFANNTAIPNGRYRILMRALKVTGDPTNERDYESWLSPVININA